MLRFRMAAIKRRISGWVHYCLPVLFLGRAFLLQRRGTAGGSTDRPASILVLKLDRIGDVVLATPMLRELRRVYPEARVTLVVTTVTQPLVEHCPYVDEVLAVRPNTGRLSFVLRELSSVVAFCRRQFARRAWDIAITARWDADYHFAALLSCYSGAPRRIAFTEKSSALKRLVNWRFDRLYTELLPPGHARHEVERNLDIVRYLGGDVENGSPELWLTAADRQDARLRWEKMGLHRVGHVIALGVGASHGRKVWPAVRFSELIGLLQRELDTAVVLICGHDELELARDVQRQSAGKALILEGPTLREAAAFLERCALFIGNDSGPIHIAAALGLPVVGIWCHPASGDPLDEHSPARFGPFTRQRVVIQPARSTHPCQGRCVSDQPHCIAKVSAIEVAEAAKTLLVSRSAGAGQELTVQASVG